MSLKIKFPEHEKLKALNGKSHACGDFIEWLAGKGFQLKHPRHKPFIIRKYLSEFFDIDEQKLEEEKMLMLSQLKGEVMKKTPGARLAMACPFCDDPANVKACKGTARGAGGQDYYWRCTCGARGFFPDSHFKRLDKLKKISITS